MVDPSPGFARLKRRGVGLVLPARGSWCGVRRPLARAGWFVLVLRSWCMVCLSSAEQRLEPRGVFVTFHLERQFCYRMFSCIVSGRFPRQGRNRGPLAQDTSAPLGGKGGRASLGAGCAAAIRWGFRLGI